MTFERTHDVELIRSILTDPRCYCRMVNDTAPAVAEFSIQRQHDIIYVICEAGLWLVIPTAPHVAEIHFCIRPEWWGRANEVAAEFLAWVWHATSLNLLIGRLPAYNRLALKLAKTAGFQDTGMRQGPIKKRGVSYDILVLEKWRPDALAVA